MRTFRTALADLFVLNGSIEVGACDDDTPPCAAGTVDGSLVPWSYTFAAAELSSLVRISRRLPRLHRRSEQLRRRHRWHPTLDLEVAPTPEPASIFTLAGGLLAFAALRRRGSNLHSIQRRTEEHEEYPRPVRGAGLVRCRPFTG